jgi:hypothetical protein
MADNITKLYQKQLDQINKLLEKGKRSGFLTYDEINELLPEDLLSPDKIDEILFLFDDNGIEIIDSEVNKTDYDKTSKEPERPWYIGSIDWGKRHNYTPSQNVEERFFEIENWKKEEPKILSNSLIVEDFCSPEKQGYKKIEDLDNLISHNNDSHFEDYNNQDLGIKNTFIWISMLTWCGASIGLHLCARHPEITIFSIKFLFFFLGGFFVLSYVIGSLFFCFALKIVPKSDSPNIFFSFQWIIKNRKILYFFNSTITFLVANYLFYIYYD